ncbi:Rna helicase [Pleurostoma richardsiae]|uniref:Rna helicase n=1 Tax=Pleurostoma richardsiae TaxID=41990 RepID=A0AA38VX65_9PEZI|nr:Rna helicase [Pleurostoma richardsiae]
MGDQFRERDRAGDARDRERLRSEGRAEYSPQRRRRRSRSQSPYRGDEPSIHERRRARSPIYRGESSLDERQRPHAASSGRHHQQRRSRSRSSHRSHHSHHHHRHRRSSTRSVTSAPPEDGLPFGARPLSRSDLAAFQPLFAHYLDLQKGLRLRDLDEHEVRGRWKSFVGKWNRGELAEGWYDPEMLQRLVESPDEGDEPASGARQGGTPRTGRTPPVRGHRASEDVGTGGGSERRAEEDDSDDSYGPSLPPASGARAEAAPSDRAAARKSGPGIPSLDDLDMRREAAAEERQSRAEDLRLARRLDRAEQKARLDELLPRAEAGTRERQLEKRRLLNEKLRGFRERSPGGGGAAEVDEGELMGGGDGADEYRRMLQTAQKRKSERELRREEEQRARAAEVEERLRRYREREEETVGALRELARRRFG